MPVRPLVHTALLALALTACGGASAPPPLYIAPVEAASAKPVVTTHETLPPLPPESTPTTVTAVAVDTSVVGSWRWNDDLRVLRADGTGTYFRAGAVCFELTYTIEGDVYHELADRQHACAGATDLRYRFAIDGSTMTMWHVGSGYETHWEREP